MKDIALHTEMFSVQNGLLTPTLKAKRAELRNHFRQQIDQLYSKIHVWKRFQNGCVGMPTYNANCPLLIPPPPFPANSFTYTVISYIVTFGWSVTLKKLSSTRNCALSTQNICCFSYMHRNEEQISLFSLQGFKTQGWHFRRPLYAVIDPEREDFNTCWWQFK